MVLGEFAADADHMHDREKAGALEIILGHRDRIGKQPADMRMAVLDERRRARRDEAIDLAGFEQAEMVAPSGALSSRTPGGSLTVIFSGRPASSMPPRIQWMSRALDAVIVFEESARPDIGGELIFGHADFAAFEVCGFFMRSVRT